MQDDLADARLERAIQAACDEFHVLSHAGKITEAQLQWARFCELVAERSTEQIAKMERERGLQ